MDAQRLKVIAYNAIVKLFEDNFIDFSESGSGFKEYVMEELGITEEEYDEIMEG